MEAQDRSQDVLRQVIVLDDAREPRVDVIGIDTDRATFELGCVEGNVVQQPLHHGIQPPRADIFLFFVDVERDLGEAADPVGLERKLDALGREQCLVLARQARVRRGLYFL
jgi:hypothetical protein